jgi:ribosomal protein L37E
MSLYEVYESTGLDDIYIGDIEAPDLKSAKYEAKSLFSNIHQSNLIFYKTNKNTHKYQEMMRRRPYGFYEPVCATCGLGKSRHAKNEVEA